MKEWMVWGAFANAAAFAINLIAIRRYRKLIRAQNDELSVYETHCLHMRARRDCAMPEAKAAAERGITIAEVMAGEVSLGPTRNTSLIPSCCKCGRQDWKNERLAYDTCPGKQATEDAINHLIQGVTREEDQEKDASAT